MVLFLKNFFKQKENTNPIRTREDAKKYMQEQNMEVIYDFIKNNRKPLCSTSFHIYYVFVTLNFYSIDLPIQLFQTYIDHIIKYKTDTSFLQTKEENDWSYYARCLLCHTVDNKKPEHLSYLLKTNLISVPERDLSIWDSLFQEDSDKETDSQIFHLLMNHGGDLNNTSFKNGRPIIHSLLHTKGSDFFKELQPYIHTIHVQHLKLYKQKRLEHLF